MKLPSITFTQDALSRFEQVIDKEWLITNGLGGYASSSVLGINTRKYHGLLVAALHPPGDRTVCLSKLDEDLIVGADTYRLGTNEFHDKMYPEGYKFIKQFSIAPYPNYSYDVGNVKVDKTVFMPKGKNAVCAIYNVANGNNSEVTFRIYPHVNLPLLSHCCLPRQNSFRFHAEKQCQTVRNYLSTSTSHNRVTHNRRLVY